MRQRTADWFETKIRYDKTMDDGMLKPITEQYVVDALSFTEAENAIIEEMRLQDYGHQPRPLSRGVFQRKRQRRQMV